MKDSNVNLKEMSSHEITTFPLGYFSENDLIPTASEKIGRKEAFLNFDKNWKQLIDDQDTQSSEGYYMDTGESPASSEES